MQGAARRQQVSRTNEFKGTVILKNPMLLFANVHQGGFTRAVLVTGLIQCFSNASTPKLTKSFSQKSPESGHNQSSCRVYVVWASQSVRDNHRAHL